MKQRNRRGFSAAEKTELRDRRQRGELLNAIGRPFGEPSVSIHCQPAPDGGGAGKRQGGNGGGNNQDIHKLSETTQGVRTAMTS